MLISLRVGEALKIKVRPEDFVVSEALDIALTENGQHRVYILHKRGWNTVDAVGAVARASGVPVSQVRYAGLKDRHALTSQYVTVPRQYVLTDKVPGISPEDLRLEQVGFSEDFVSTHNLRGNSFEVTLRSLSPEEAESIRSRIPEVKRAGFPNYFDDQRFGSVPPSGDLLAERILKGHLKGALRLYLTAEYPGLTAAEKARRQAMSGAWGDWAAVQRQCQSGVEKRIVETLQRGGNKKNLLDAVNAIPSHEMTMYFAAFQASIWNRVLCALVGPATGATLSVPGKAGDYLFPRDAASGLLEKIQSAEIPTVARRILPCEPDVQATISSSIAERGLTASDLNLRGIRSAYLKSFYRRAVVVPDGLVAGEIVRDDLYRGRSKLVIRFSLPKGSYATMLLKALA